VRYLHYQQKNKDRGTSEENFIFNLRQTSDHVGAGMTCVPALLRRSQIVNGSRARYMIPIEHLAVQQVPVLLKSSKHKCVIQNVIDSKLVNWHTLRSLAGNGMNLQVCAMIFYYLMAAAKPV
jgi:hypothetical protein